MSDIEIKTDIIIGGIDSDVIIIEVINDNSESIVLIDSVDSSVLLKKEVACPTFYSFEL